MYDGSRRLGSVVWESRPLLCTGFHVATWGRQAGEDTDVRRRAAGGQLCLRKGRGEAVVGGPDSRDKFRGGANRMCSGVR